MKPIVIVGSGHAGLTTIREIRKIDREVDIILVSEDAASAYYKPNLSKALTANKQADDLILKDPETLAKELNIGLLNYTKVVSIDAQNSCVKVNGVKGNELIEYSDLVLAIGARPIKVPIIGNAKNDIMAINSLDDYKHFRSKLSDRARVLVMGAGFVGCELASDLSTAGHKVDVVDLAEWPMQRLLPREIGSELENFFSAPYVEWHFNTSVVKTTRIDKGIEVELANGNVRIVDLIISAVGLIPSTELAFDAGIKVSKGIYVNEYLRTNISNIYALGDCAELLGHNLPFIAPASLSAKALAKTLTGEATTVKLPHFEVAVKLNGFPLIVGPPQSSKGKWVVTKNTGGYIARFMDEGDNVNGFALSGENIAIKNDLSKECIASAYYHAS